jgi:hypothetical protein
LAIGKVFIFLFQRFPLPNVLKKYKTFEYLHSCDLCSGVWIFSVLAWAMQMDLLTVMNFRYVAGISEGVTGGVVSFIVWLLSLGWREAFTPTLEI